jgi:hypothetical protein
METHPTNVAVSELKSFARIVSHGLRNGTSKQIIVAELVMNGISERDALPVYEEIEHGLKAGVNAAVTNGLSAREYKRGEAPLHDVAFDEGMWAFRREMCLIRLKRFGIPLLIIILIAVVVFAVLR